MAQVHVVILDEGEFSDREWSVMAVCSTLDQALARACKLVAESFKESNQTWSNFYVPYLIQTWTVDGTLTAGEDRDVTLAEVERRHPDLAPVIKARAQAAAQRERLLEDARVRERKLAKRRHLDDLLRERALTVEQYYEGVDALERASS